MSTFASPIPRASCSIVTLVADLVDEDLFEEGFMFDGSSTPAGSRSTSPT